MQDQHDQEMEREITAERKLEMFITETDARLVDLQRRRTYGARSCPYTVPLKPTAGCVDGLRLKSELDVKKVSTTVSRIRKLMKQAHREIQDAQRSQYKYLKTKPRRTEYAAQLRQAQTEFADARQLQQSRARALNDRGEDRDIEDILHAANQDNDSDYDDGLDEPDLR